MHNRKEDVLLVNDALDIEMENWDDEMRHEVYLTNLDPTTGHKNKKTALPHQFTDEKHDVLK